MFEVDDLCRPWRGWWFQPQRYRVVEHYQHILDLPPNPPRTLHTVTVVLAVVSIGKDVVIWIRTFTRPHRRTALWGDVVLLCLPQESLGKILGMTWFEEKMLAWRHQTKPSELLLTTSCLKIHETHVYANATLKGGFTDLASAREVDQFRLYGSPIGKANVFQPPWLWGVGKLLNVGGLGFQQMIPRLPNDPWLSPLTLGTMCF